MKSSVYGSRQGAHDWFNHFNETVVKDLGYKPCKIDLCVYKRENEDGISFLGLYTDDIIHLPCNIKEKMRFKAELMKRYITKISLFYPLYFRE
jgi:hypothetical protein